MSKNKIIIAVAAIILIVVLGTVIGISVANSSFKEISQEEFEQLVLEAIKPQLTELENQLGVYDIKTELYITEYECKKPTVFNAGAITANIRTLYFVADEFLDLDDGIYNAEIYRKYANHKLNFTNVQIPDYSVSISTRGINIADFKNANGDIYTFVSFCIYKNHEEVFVHENSSSSNPGLGKKCAHCNGTGSVKYYYGGSAWEAFLAGMPDYTFGPCTSCNGKGYN